MFNGITTWIEEIVAPRGFSTSQAGLARRAHADWRDHRRRGAAPRLRLASPAETVRHHRARGARPGLLGVTFATTYWLLLASSFVFGFFLLSAGPIGFQYGAEMTLPAPEGTSNTLLLVAGQLSGIIFIFLMDAVKSPQGSMTAPLLGLLALTLVSIGLASLLKESPISVLRNGRSGRSAR